MTEIKENITRPFAFLKTSANPLAAHCQAAQADTQTKTCQRATILPTPTMTFNINLNFLQMKKTILILTILMCLFTLNIQAQCGGTTTTKSTSIGIVISSNDVETIWNAIRFANFSKNQGDTVNIFLLGKGVELDTLVKTNTDLKEQTDAFLESGGTILGCGTCLQSRKYNEPQVCKFSSMKDLYDLVRKNKIVLTF